MSKKKHDPVKALMDAFHAEVNDTELQENYNRFERDLKRVKEHHNQLVPLINSTLQKIQTLKDAVLNQAIHEIIATDAIKRLSDLEKEKTEYIEKIEMYMAEISRLGALMEKYEDWSERKLFLWWKVIKVVDPETMPWLEWRETYEGKII